MEPLLSRKQFNELVFKRDGDKCVMCSKKAVDAHHIIERKLWNDGGYYLSNGVSLCSNCHWKAETTEISCEKLWDKIGVKKFLPTTFDQEKSYDKWGNTVNDDNSRIAGPMFDTEQVQKVLKRSGLIYLFYLK